MACVMSEWATGALYGAGLVVVARLFLPVLDPSTSAGEIAAQFAEHRDRIRLGALLMVIGCGFFAPFGAVCSRALDAWSQTHQFSRTCNSSASAQH
jgi:hypothetical protein